jgi:hypothetical protein
MVGPGIAEGLSPARYLQTLIAMRMTSRDTMNVLKKILRMKTAALSAAFVCAAVLLTGCGKGEADTSAVTSNDPVVQAALASQPPDPVDLTQFLKAFATADAGLKLYADETVAVIRARVFRDAVEQLQKLSQNPNLSPEQRQAIHSVMTQLQSLPGGR